MRPKCNDKPKQNIDLRNHGEIGPARALFNREKASIRLIGGAFSVVERMQDHTEMECHPMTRISRTGFAAASAVAALSLVFTTGCSTKNYVRSQTEPVITKTNELDDATATNNRAIHDVDSRAQSGIQQAQNSANQAQTSAQNAQQSASTAQSSAQDAVNRADSLAGVVANLDNYKQVGDVSVTFAFNKGEPDQRCQGSARPVRWPAFRRQRATSSK